MAIISHTKIKQPSFGEKKAKINLPQNFPIFGIRSYQSPYFTIHKLNQRLLLGRINLLTLQFTN